MTTYTTTSNNTELKLEITYLKELKTTEVNLDGYISEKEEIQETSEIKVYANGKCLGNTKDLYLNEIKNSGYEGRVPAEITHYIEMNNGKAIPLTEEQANEIKAIIDELKATEITKEAAEFEEVKAEEEIVTAKAIIEKAEKQISIPSYREARLKEKSYNNLHNEGGEGYVPHIVDIDEYNWAKSVLAGLRLS